MTKEIRTIEYAAPQRMWLSTHVTFKKALAAINRKRPITKSMKMPEFLDEVAHGRIQLSDKKPLRVLSVKGV